MDPIALYLQTASPPYGSRPAKKLILSAFLHVHSRLSMLQLNKGQITYDDLIQSLQFAISSGMIHDIMITQELSVYAGVLYETCFQPAMLMKGPGFVLYKDLIGNEATFLQATLEVLLAHSPLGKENPMIEEFRVDVAMTLKKLPSSSLSHSSKLHPAHMNQSPAMIHGKQFLHGSAGNYNHGGSPHQRNNFSPSNQMTGRKTLPVATHGVGGSPYGSTAQHPSMSSNAYQHLQHSAVSSRTNDYLNHNQYPGADRFAGPVSHNKPTLSHMSGLDYQTPAVVSHPAPVLTHTHSFSANNNNINNNNSNNTSSAVVAAANSNNNVYRITEIEKSEPIVRLLAHLRKSGMDILFPQIIHDKILMCIYVAITCTNSLTHRELIDMVMAIKDSDIISQISVISKTKIRGALALLKHGQLFLTKGEDGEAVQLYLAEGIHSFQDLRERHDHYLQQWILQHHLYIPAVLKGELLWQIDAETKAMRLQELKMLEETIEHYYMNIYQPSPSGKGIPITGEGLTTTTTTTSSPTITNFSNPSPSGLTAPTGFFPGLGITHQSKATPANESQRYPLTGLLSEGSNSNKHNNCNSNSYTNSYSSYTNNTNNNNSSNAIHPESFLPPGLASTAASQNNNNNSNRLSSSDWDLDLSHFHPNQNHWNQTQTQTASDRPVQENNTNYSLFPSSNRTNPSDINSQGSGGSQPGSETRFSHHSHHSNHTNTNSNSYWIEPTNHATTTTGYRGRVNSNTSLGNAMTDIDSSADPSQLIAKTSSLSLSTSLPMLPGDPLESPHNSEMSYTSTPAHKVVDLESMKFF